MAVLVTRTVTCSRWAGELEDVREIIALASSRLGSWREGQPVDVSVIVRLEDGTSFDGKGPDVLDEVHATDLPRIKTVRFSAAGDGDGRAWVTWDSQKTPAVSGGVEGEERDRVEGLVALLGSALLRGQQWPRWWFDIPTLLFLPLGIGLGLLGLFSVRWLGYWHQASASAGERGLMGSEGIWFAVGAMGLVLVVVAWRALPTLELLAPGQRPRLRRTRGGLLTFGLGVAASIVAALLLLPAE
jgi:hypothetical protein